MSSPARSRTAVWSALLLTLGTAAATIAAESHPLWDVYEKSLRTARYVDLTHTIAPGIPVWSGFGPSTSFRTVNPATHQPYRYASDGFEATGYMFSSDQLGTQLDPPAHWAPEFPSIDELPATFAVRPLVVISIVEALKRDPNYALQVSDILSWEKAHGTIPRGSVVFVRSDWSKRWPDPELAKETKFPGVSLAALQFLHEQRHILMHGHEPLDTDSTPTLEGESWLMHHGYTQAEGVANLDQVPEAGALVTIGFPKLAGGTGGYARYIAICPPDWKYGIQISKTPDSPLPRSDHPLHWDDAAGHRVR